MSPKVCPIVEAPSHISYSPVTQYPLLYSTHAFSSKSVVSGKSLAFKLGGTTSIMSVEQTLPSKVAKSKLPIGNDLWLALLCPNRAQGLFGRGLLIMVLSYAKDHSCTCKDHLIPACMTTAWHFLIRVIHQDRCNLCTS